MDYFMHDDYCCEFKTWPCGADTVAIAGFGTSREGGKTERDCPGMMRLARQ